MTTSQDTKILHEILGDEFTQQIVKELGLEGDSAEAQADLISMIGENILGRVVLEILKVLPKERHAEFEKFMGSGDLVGLREFLMPHIPDLDRFIQESAMNEYEATKTRAHQILQGVDVNE